MGIKANQKYDASKLDEHKRDHSLYMAAAPLPAPTIALAVVVENAGFGSEAAAPMARRVIDYVLLGHYPSEEDIALTRKGQSGAPVGVPRRAVDVPLPGQVSSPLRQCRQCRQPQAPHAPAGEATQLAAATRDRP